MGGANALHCETLSKIFKIGSEFPSHIHCTQAGCRDGCLHAGTVKGKDTKSCVIRFDQSIINAEVKRSQWTNEDTASKFGSSVGISKHTAYSMPPNGVSIVTLWSREWDTEFEVTVKWNATASSSAARDEHAKFSWRSLLPSRLSRGPTYTGRIGCQWADNQRVKSQPSRN